MIDAVLLELDQVNSEYQKIQQAKTEISDGVARQDSAYVLQISAMEVKEWICDFGETLSQCISLSISLRYRSSELLDKLNVFAAQKVQVDVIRALKKAVRQASDESRAENE